MFITLSRRNTSLINQQLGLIETLEKDEEDPQRLESLFRLDHLAARMRRTADSLLVLADAPTHTSANDDLTVASSLQAATAGVQDYQRVRVGSASTARISDAASADVVHLLTELVDNALAYSGSDDDGPPQLHHRRERRVASRSRTPASASPTGRSPTSTRPCARVATSRRTRRAGWACSW